MQNNIYRYRKRRSSGCLTALIFLFVFIGILAGCCYAAIQSGLMKEFTNSSDVATVKDLVNSVPGIDYQEVTTEENVAVSYYYSKLSEDERQIYSEILSGINSNTEEIYLHGDDADLANKILQYVLRDHPELFWCDGSATATSYTGINSYTVMKVNYQYDENARSTMQSQIDGAVAECLAGISQDASDYEKILYVYEYIIRSVEYNMDASDNQNIYSVFVGKESVCAGYSKATQYLLNKLGIFCTYVIGTAGDDNQAHAWNLVQCNGEYYYVDTTWGDPTFLAEEGEQVAAEEKISYDYMLCDDTELFKNHTPDAAVELPSCTHMDYNYYVVNGDYYTSYDAAVILQKMNDVIAVGGSSTVIKFASCELYTAARESIFQETIPQAAENLANLYGIYEVKYQYLDEADLNKITIYWQYQ